MTNFLRKFLSFFLILAFWTNTLLPAYAQETAGFSLPSVGEQVALSPAFSPVLLKAVKVNPDNAFRFDFIVDVGSSNLKGDELKTQAQKLIRYFLASLTTPENDLWVNLSPYENQRIIPQSFGTTEMGRDLLAEDYLLKQITATLLYPDGELGKKYWGEVNKIRTLDAGRLTLEKNSSTSVQPQTTNTFNKVWIVPQKAVVYENGTTAYVDETYLKVMLEEEYVALENNTVIASKASPFGTSEAKQFFSTEIASSPAAPRNDINKIGSQILRELIVPELEKEVNEGKNFASLRQIYNSLILANWYKKRLKDSILSQIYVDKNKVTGIDLDDKEQAQRIYNQYVEAFKKGVYNYIKEDYDPLTQETVPRKYFSGGMGLASASVTTEYRQGLPEKNVVASSTLLGVTVNFDFSNKRSTVKEVEFPQSEILLSPQDLARSEVLQVLYSSQDMITKNRRMTLRIKAPDGNIRILKLYSDRNNFINESLGYAVAEKLGMHVPKHQEFEESSDFDGLVKQAVKVGNLLQEFTQPYGWARLIERVQEYKTDKAYNGLEELVVFTHLMHFDDFEDLRAQYGFSKNIYVTFDGKFVVYDYETAWKSTDPAIYFFSYKNVADRIDRSKLERAIKKARQLTANDFSEFLTDQQSREIFHKRVNNFENDMIRELSYWTNEPQAVRLLGIVKNMQSSSPVGGIDLTAAKTPLDIRGQGQPVQFNFDPKQLQNLQFDGLVPVIINIVPVVNLPQFLTKKSLSKPAAQLSRSH